MINDLQDIWCSKSLLTFLFVALKGQTLLVSSSVIKLPKYQETITSVGANP